MNTLHLTILSDTPIAFCNTPDQLLVTTNQRIYEADLNNMHLAPEAIPLPKHLRNINNILPTNNGFWFVGWGHGIMKYEDGQITDFPGGAENGLKHKWTHDLTYGPDHHLWAGQQNGLYKIDTISNTITCLAHSGNLNRFTNSNFKALAFDHLDRLWVGNFGGGIACYDIAQDSVLSPNHCTKWTAFRPGV